MMYKRTIKFLTPIAFFTAFSLLIHCAKQDSPNRDDAKLKELEQISSSVPTFPTFASVDTSSSSALDDAGIYKYYRSSSSFYKVKDFYVEELSQRSWSLAEETTKGLKFRKGEYLIAVQYAGSNSELHDWNYAVSFVWRDY